MFKDIDDLKFTQREFENSPWSKPFLRSGEPVLAFKSTKLQNEIFEILKTSLSGETMISKKISEKIAFFNNIRFLIVCIHYLSDILLVYQHKAI